MDFVCVILWQAYNRADYTHALVIVPKFIVHDTIGLTGRK